MTRNFAFHVIKILNYVDFTPENMKIIQQCTKTVKPKVEKCLASAADEIDSSSIESIICR